MSLEVQNSVVRFIEKTISVFNIKHINISWYGGEPLMAIDIISLLSNSIIEICDSNNIIYNASIVTNGYFLTPKVIELLVRNRIKRIQVTIDGGPDTHNSRRPNKNGGPTFDRIMNNLKNFNNTNILVRIRINVDKENFCDYKQVIESIKLSTNENSKIIPYIALVEKYDNTTYDEKSCLSLSEFANIKIEFDEYLSGSLNNNGFGIYTMRKTTFCGADTFFNYVIDADGFVYSCWIDLGDKSLSMGQIHEIKGNDVKNAIRLRYLSYDATTDKKCLLCKLLPICMGGCPRKKRTSLERCSESIYSLEQQLKQTATRIIKMRSYINTRNENGGVSRIKFK